METENNKENQKEISLNNNKNDEQSKKVSEEFKEKVQKIIKENLDNFVSEDKIIKDFSKATKEYLPKYKDSKNIVGAISKIVNNNPDYATYIVNGFTQGCIDKDQNITNIGKVINEIIQTDGIKDNPDLVSDIIDGFTQGCILEEEKLTNIGNTISEIANKNQDSAIYIADGFTQGCISKGKKPTDISDTISNIVQGNQDSAGNIICAFTVDYIDEDQKIEDIGKVINGIIQTDGIKDNPDLVSDIIDGFTQGCIFEEEELTDIGDTISEIVNKNQDSAICIAYGFAQSCISQRKDLKDEDISGAISKIVKGNQDSAINIIDGFTQGYISQEKNLKNEDIGNAIHNIIEADGIKSNSNLVYDIVVGFTLGYISGKKYLTGISDIISEIVNKNQDSAFDIIDCFTQVCISQEKDLTSIGNEISTIIKTDGIKNNPDLVFNVINGFFKGCLALKPDNIKDTAESFFKLLNTINKNNFGENEEEIKDKLKPIFSLIVSKYFINTLTNSSNEQSSEDNKKTEEQLFNCYKKLFHVENEQGFQDISLEKLSNLQDKYLKERFKEKGVDGGIEREIFLKMACNLILKSENNEKSTVENLEDKNKPTVADLEKQKDIFKDLKFIRLNNNDGITSKKELFEKIGLKPEDFGNRRKGEFSDFSIIHCSYLNHGFVMIIDKTQEWEKAKKPETESICLIDSSQTIKTVKNNFSYLLKDKQDIFNSAPTLNGNIYQKNGTCWLNAMSAVGFLLEKQQEQVKQTDQQVTKPYGLSINELLKGFGKERNNNGEIGKITESKTSQEEPHSFEQGICDYSTEHFYTLTNITDKERDIIKKFLAEQVEKNKADQEYLSIASRASFERLINEKNLIITCDRLRESLERLAQNTEKLKELRNKFNIKDTQSSESERKEDLDGKKQSNISSLGDIKTLKCKETTELQNIQQQSNNRQEQGNNIRAK